MKISNVLNCSFPSWYGSFKNVTFDSIIIPLPEAFITYLHTDGIVLPDSSTHGLYSNTDNLAMDGDEDEKEMKDDELMKKYEADWSTSDVIQTAQMPNLDEFEKRVKRAIASLGGRVFPKLNWSSPKDATWICFDKSLLCTCPSDIYLLLKSSQFIAHDLDQPFHQCQDWAEVQQKMTQVTYALILRQWQPPDPSTEFRCFVHENRVVGICQRNHSKFYPHILHERETILQDILTFHEQKISQKFQDPSYVFDVIHLSKGQVLLVDFNPYGPVTDTLLFTWHDLEQLAGEASSVQLPCFRYVETEDGIQSSHLASFSLPQDIQDLSAGEDPRKLLDLMKMDHFSASFSLPTEGFNRYSRAR